MALGELTPGTAFAEATLFEPPGTAAAGAATVEAGKGAPVAWSREGAGAGALTTVSDVTGLNEEEAAGLPLGAATAELALDAECSRSRLSKDTSEPFRECLRSLLLDFVSFFSSFFSSCRS